MNRWEYVLPILAAASMSMIIGVSAIRLQSTGDLTNLVGIIGGGLIIAYTVQLIKNGGY